MGNCSCSNPKQDNNSDREKWLLWEEPSFLMLFCGKCEYCCTCEQGKFKDDYPPFLAARGIDEQAFKADVAAHAGHFPVVALRGGDRQETGRGGTRGRGG